MSLVIYLFTDVITSNFINDSPVKLRVRRFDTRPRLSEYPRVRIIALDSGEVINNHHK